MYGLGDIFHPAGMLASIHSSLQEQFIPLYTIAHTFNGMPESDPEPGLYLYKGLKQKTSYDVLYKMCSFRKHL